MPETRPKTRRLSALFLLGCLLFNYPILSLFNREIFPFGIPLLYLYLFSVWLLLILLTALGAHSKTSSPRPEISDISKRSRK